MPGEPPGSSDPLDPARLVGRAAEAAAIRRTLDGAPLVTVTRLPGVGKTAVSLAAAGFADGSLLLLYTDGVSEARDADGRFFPLVQITADTVRGTGPDRAPPKIGVSSRVQLASWLRTRPPQSE